MSLTCHGDKHGMITNQVKNYIMKQWIKDEYLQLYINLLIGQDYGMVD